MAVLRDWMASNTSPTVRAAAPLSFLLTSDKLGGENELELNVFSSDTACTVCRFAAAS